MTDVEQSVIFLTDIFNLAISIALYNCTLTRLAFWSAGRIWRSLYFSRLWLHISICDTNSNTFFHSVVLWWSAISRFSWNKSKVQINTLKTNNRRLKLSTIITFQFSSLRLTFALEANSRLKPLQYLHCPFIPSQLNHSKI